MYVACEDHVEHALDEFTVEFEKPPDLYQLDAVPTNDVPVPEHCHFCSRPPIYLIT